MSNQPGTSEASAEPIIGTVRVDENVQRLAARLLPGEIAVIDQPDLDRASAVVLLAKRPMAVLNAAPSTTGRSPSIGAQMVVGEGIPLIDSLGPDVMVLTEGDLIGVFGHQVVRGEQLIAEGEVRSAEELSQRRLDSRGRLGIQVQAFTQGAQGVWQREHGVLLDGDEVPRLDSFNRHSTALIIDPSATDVKKMRPMASDMNTVVIGVNEGGDAAMKLRRGLDVFIGDPTGVSEKTLRRANHRVLLDRGGEVPGKRRLDALGLTYSTLPTSANGVDAAILLADVNGASEIITAGLEGNLETFFEGGSGQQVAGFFIRTRAWSKTVSVAVAEKLYRPRVSAWWLAFMLLAALIVLAIAVWLTPWGEHVSEPLRDWVVNWWSPGQSGEGG